MFVALVWCADATELTLGSDSPLTEREQRKASGITHARRRDEWMAGRIAAKWLVLRYGASDASTAWPPRLHEVGIEELSSLPLERYRSVEVCRDDDGAPYLAGAAAGAARVSIAHRGGWAVAALNADGVIGIDLEEIAPRRPGFYESNLSDAERRWMLGAREADTDRVGTLLWTLKEACLKTGASVARTIWEIGAIDLDVGTPASSIAATWSSSDIGRSGGLVNLPARIPLAGTPDSSFHAAYGVVGGMVIGIVAERTSELKRRGGFS